MTIGYYGDEEGFSVYVHVYALSLGYVIWRDRGNGEKFSVSKKENMYMCICI